MYKGLQTLYLCMAKYFLLLMLVFCGASAQKGAVKITYNRYSHDKLVQPHDPILAFADAHRTVITTSGNLAGTSSRPFEQTMVSGSRMTQAALLQSGKYIFTSDSTSILDQKFELKPDRKKILGYDCAKAVTIVNSNTIEIWYTTATGFKAAPSTLGIGLGTVLELVRNGNFALRAEKVEKLKSIPQHALAPFANPATVDMLTYRDRLWKSRFVTVPIFKDETINFTDSPAAADSVFRFAKGTVIARKVRFPDFGKGSRVFLDVSSRSDGDAYDRTGSIILMPDGPGTFMEGIREGAKSLPVYENGNGKKYQGVVRMASYEPSLELMRFFTPFGVGKYNTIKLKGRTWQDSAYYRQDISDLAPALRKREVWIAANISNYDKGGHKLAANITIHPEDPPTPEYSVVLPLFNTNSFLEVAGQDYATMFDVEKGLEVEFELERDVTGAVLRYITTGHGGWENGDEFVKKTNTIFLDGQKIHSFIPWRDDCGSYRLLNPASGNFPNGLSSSDYSRSNWCPGMTAIPVEIPLGDLKKGKHTLRVQIPQGKPEGGSFSSWNVSGVLLGK